MSDIAVVASSGRVDRGSRAVAALLELRGRLAAAVGDAPSSDRTFREALDLYRAIGATGHAERPARELDA